jgi:hypothetical protein
VSVKEGYEPAQQAGFCNSAMPNDSTFNRFLWFVNLLARNGERAHSLLVHAGGMP